MLETTCLGRAERRKKRSLLVLRAAVALAPSSSNISASWRPSSFSAAGVRIKQAQKANGDCWVRCALLLRVRCGLRHLPAPRCPPLPSRVRQSLLSRRGLPAPSSPLALRLSAFALLREAQHKIHHKSPPHKAPTFMVQMPLNFGISTRCLNTLPKKAMWGG